MPRAPLTSLHNFFFFFNQRPAKRISTESRSNGPDPTFQLRKDQKHQVFHYYYQTSPSTPSISSFIFFYTFLSLSQQPNSLSQNPLVSLIFFLKILSGISWGKDQVFTSISARKPEVIDQQFFCYLLLLFFFFFLFITNNFV